jgi:hypothetical protein
MWNVAAGASMPAPIVNGQWVKGAGDVPVWSAITLGDVQGFPAVVNGQWLKGVGGVPVWSPIARADLPIAPFCRLYASQMNFASGQWVTCPWDAELFDNDNMHDNVTANSRITCRTGGIYVFVAGIYWAGAGGTHRVIRIVRNGATSGAEVLGIGQTGLFSGTATLTASQDMRTEAIALWPMNANDYCEVQTYHDAGGTVISYAGGYSWFGAAYLGRYS